MIGIYKYTNNINGKVYIGQSINLEQRKYAHKSSAFNEKAKKKEKALKFDSKLADCYSKDRLKCEIYVTEGK